ncbi:hypothetical protein Pint_09822 [Pistacia integerrima]|uniref:Uncharacterized protein n=1 Tax=Pistacia integerrima TaxID=434235 RepID=A0ACC0XFR4_9ROSI|nr:hypothetical protein Pint_09822 [Pistacia integerrima]
MLLSIVDPHRIKGITGYAPNGRATLRPCMAMVTPTSSPWMAPR